MPHSYAQTNWFEKNPKKTIFAIILFGLIVIILLAEMGARVLLPQWCPTRAERADFWVYDEMLGWAHKRNQRGSFNHRDFSIEVSINSSGLRDDEYSLNKTDKKRMLVLGDSYSWGYGVEHDEIFCEVIERKHPDWEVINASVSGYGTDQQYLYLRERGITYEPDVVLLIFSENDFWNNIGWEQYWYYKPVFTLVNGDLVLKNYPVPKSTPLQKLDRFFYGKTYFLKRIYLQVRILVNWLRGIKDTALTYRERSGVQTNVDRPEKERYKNRITKRLLTEINNLSQNNGARFVIASVPMEEGKRRVLKELSERENIPYLPLDDYFSSIEEEVVFAHDEHWNAKGHEVAAGAIENFLFNLGLLK